jgi:hypothetical protein
VQTNLRCPRCGCPLRACAANTRSKDFDCTNCDEHFQLKSSTKALRGKLTGGEYRTTLRSVESGHHPSLILMRYSRVTMTVLDVEFVHRACITASCLIPRLPLTATARRAGWQGTLFDLDQVPQTARVRAVFNGAFLPIRELEDQWAVADRILLKRPETRGWAADLLLIVDQLPGEFALVDVYAFENDLARKHPENFNVRPKMRQQLQVLRDMGFITFGARGVYRKVALARRVRA